MYIYAEDASNDFRNLEMTDCVTFDINNNNIRIVRCVFSQWLSTAAFVIEYHAIFEYYKMMRTSV